MRICQIRILGFRGIRDGLITLSSHTALLGANNAGKSTIAEALALLFARERMVRPISDWDFFGGFPKPDSRFYIIATVTDFGESDDPTHYPDWFIGQSVATPIWWIEESATVAFDTEQPDGSKLAAQIAIAGRYEEETCEYETVRYFYHGESDPFIDGCESIPPRLLREVGVFLLSGNRDWDKLLSFGSSTLLKVVREYEALPGAAIETLKNQLRTEVIKIEESSPLRNVSTVLRHLLVEFSVVSSHFSYSV